MIELFIIFMFHHPKKSQEFQMYCHEVKIINKVSGCYTINNSFEIN
jgi:hypothetical protein